MNLFPKIRSDENSFATGPIGTRILCCLSLSFTVTRQSACLVVDPVKIITLLPSLDRASDTMMDPT